MGLGRFGGGLGVTRWLAGQGSRVVVTDLASEQDLAGPVAELRDLFDAGVVELGLGGHREFDFERAERVIVNPAVPRPWENRYIAAADRAGVALETEIGLACARIATSGVASIAVTGTAGKSTTTAMIAAGARAAGLSVLVGGNLGGSLLADDEPLAHADLVVLELSSAQLYWLDRLGTPWRPRVSVVTTFAPNHLDWHGSMGEYERCKRWLVGRGERRVLGPGLDAWGDAEAVRVAGAIEGRVSAIGAHNAVNAAVAVAAMETFDPALDIGRVSTGVSGFVGLPHRLEDLGERPVGGPGRGTVRGVNDSKCSTPGGVGVAVRAVLQDKSRGGEPPLVHVIVGGYDKGVDLAEIGGLARSRVVASLLCVGATGAGIARDGGDRAHVCGDVASAVARAGELVKSEPERRHVVLLSPGCASWDQFVNFEARGEAFKEAFGREFGDGARVAGGG